MGWDQGGRSKNPLWAVQLLHFPARTSMCPQGAISLPRVRWESWEWDGDTPAGMIPRSKRPQGCQNPPPNTITILECGLLARDKGKANLLYLHPSELEAFLGFKNSNFWVDSKHFSCTAPGQSKFLRAGDPRHGQLGLLPVYLNQEHGGCSELWSIQSTPKSLHLLLQPPWSSAGQRDLYPSCTPHPTAPV